MVKNYFLSAALLAAATLTAGAQGFSMLPFAPSAAHAPAATAEGETGEITYGYYTGTEELMLLGVGTIAGETVDLAIRINDSSLSGSQIKGVSFYALGTDVSHYSDFKVWISTTLTPKGTTIKQSKDVTVTEEGMYRVDFDEPYTIPLTGCYIGYSYTVDQVVSDYDQAIVMADGAKNNSFNIHSSRTYTTWKNYSTAGYGMLTLQAHVLIEGMPEISVSVDGVADVIYAGLTDETVQIPVTLTNKGTQAITSVTYDYTIGGVSGTATAETNLPNVYNCQGEITLTLPTPAEAGTYPVQIDIKALNGTEVSIAPVTTTVSVMSFIPKHRVLIEEYTGTWCGWCPRGAVAMHKMRELYPDDFVGVCIHNGDAMQITAAYPNNVAGFPNAYLERTVNADPYYGTGNNNFGIEADFLARKATIAPAELDLVAGWDEAEQDVKAQATVRFASDPQAGTYRLAYMLLADSLRGTGSAWLQQNYYTQYSASQLPADLAFLATAGSTYSPFYEDVMIDYSTPFSGITGSVPADAVANEPFNHDYTFTGVAGKSLVQNKTKLDVVVLLLKGNAVVNACKAHVEPFDATAGIEDIATDRKPAAATAAFDLTGRSLTAGAKGLQVRDGKVILVK